MAGYVPYRQQQSGQMNYQQLMQMLMLKRQMEAQEAQQGQENKKPSTSGMSDLLNSFGSGSAGAGASSYIGGGGGVTAAGDALGGLAPTMPSVGPTMTNASFLPPASGAEAGSGALGTAGTVLGAAAALKGGYDAYKGWQNNGKGVRSGLTTAGAGIGSMIMPGVGTVAGAAMGNIAGYGLQGNSWKNDAALLAVSPAALAAKKMGMLKPHKTTKTRQAERWQGLAKEGKVPDWFLQQDVSQDHGVDDNKLASGKLGGRDVWATSGMFDTFGKDWATSGDENKREQVAKRMLDEKLFDTKQGVTNVTDKNKAMEIYNQVMGGISPKQSPITNPNTSWNKGPNPIDKGWGGSNGPMKIDPNRGDNNNLDYPGMDDFMKKFGPVVPYSGQAQPAAPVRKDTPGFKDGKRIDYSRR